MASPKREAKLARVKRKMVVMIILTVLSTAVEAALWLFALKYTHGGPNDGPVMVDGPGGTPLSFLLGAGALVGVAPTLLFASTAVVAVIDFFDLRGTKGRRR